MKGGKRLSVAELRALAIKEMDDYIDMGCFRIPEIARPYLINGFELGYKMAMKRDGEPEYCTCGAKGTYGIRGDAVMVCRSCGKPVKGE